MRRQKEVLDLVMHVVIVKTFHTMILHCKEVAKPTNDESGRYFIVPMTITDGVYDWAEIYSKHQNKY